MEDNKALNSEVAEDKVEKRKTFDLSGRDIIFAILFFVTALMFSSLSIWGGFRMGYTITSLVTFVVFTIYLFNKENKKKVFPIICGLLSLVVSVSFTITSNGSVRFWSFVVVIALAAIWFNELVNEHPDTGDMGVIRMLCRSLFKGSCINLGTTIVSLFSGQGKYRKTFVRVMIGLGTALPVLLIVVPLLVSSDAAFDGMISRIIGDISSAIGKLFLAIIISPFIISFAYTLKKQQIPERKESKFKGIDNAIVISFLSAISVCYIAYLVSQLAYFFNAFAGILPEGYEFTVSAYARRGFFEMSIIAAINIVIIFGALLLSVKKENKICIASRILATFIGGFTLIIIATALSKMILYINSLGMTKLRILTSAFMVFLAIVFVAIMLRLFWSRIQVLKVAIVTAGCVLAVLGIANVNHVVAAYNYNAYVSGKLEEIDVYTIYRLGEEGVPYLVKLAENSNEDVAESAKNYLFDVVRYDEYYEVEAGYDEKSLVTITDRANDGVGAYSIARSRAYEAIENYVKKNPEFHGNVEFQFEME